MVTKIMNQSPIYFYGRFYVFLFVFLGLLVEFTPKAISQTDPVANSTFSLPSGVSLTEIEANLAATKANTELSEEDSKALIEILTSAKERIEAGMEQRDLALSLKAQTETSEIQLKKIQSELNQVLTSLEEPVTIDDSPVTDASLFAMEQDISALNSETEALREEIKSIDAAATRFSSRISSAREERGEATRSLAEMETQITAFSGSATNALDDARRTALYARRYYRQFQIRALDEEIANIPVQELLIGPRRDLAETKLQALNVRLIALRNRTGAQRLSDAQTRVTAAQQDLTGVEGMHPHVVDFAKANVGSAQQILQIVREGGNSAVIEARVNSRIKRLSEDRSLAQQILAEGNIDREYGAVLRRLRANIPNATTIENQIEIRQRAKLDISMQRILAQDKLKEFPIDYDSRTQRWIDANPDADPLSVADNAALKELYTTQRNLLSEIVSNANRKVEKMVALNSQQQELLNEIESLKTLLDQHLIWLPSTQRLSHKWPVQVLRGFATVFNPTNFVQAYKTFMEALRLHIFPSAGILILLALIIYARPKLSKRVDEMSEGVGRVQKDTFWNTPIAVISGLVTILPIALIIAWAGYLLKESNGPAFAERLGEALIVIAAIWFVVLAVRVWSQDDGLFGLHFKVKKGLRDRINKNTIWFAGAQSVAVLLMTLCEDYNSEAPIAGLGLFGFFIGTFAFALLAIRLLFIKKSSEVSISKADSFFGRRRKPIFFIALAIPFLTSLLAATGYFATALEVQTRIIITAALLLAAYITYGVAKRFVEVSQRQLALETAIAKRKQAVKEREEREAAEERGEAAVPSVDYETIDLESISRQSTQLLNLIGALIFAGLAWVLWDDLLPALSIFNEVDLPFSTNVLNADGIAEQIPVTLWDLIQGIFVGVLSFFAAKNLPGFLDLFILKRSGLAAGSRYAITTVLGYIIVIIGILLVSEQLGIEWGNLQWIIAALGVGIGFGLQEIIANFISGLIILFERPVRIGDYVTIGDQSGTINRIQIRATTLADLDNREILIPNKELITGRVTNWTLSNSTLRMIVKVGIAYGSDTDNATKIMLRTVKKIKNVQSTPEPQVLFLGFGESSLDFEIRVFLPSFAQRFPVAHDIHTQVNKALEKAGISIPFPQRDVHIVTPDMDNIPDPQGARSRPQSQSKSKPKPKSS